MITIREACAQSQDGQAIARLIHVCEQFARCGQRVANDEALRAFAQQFLVLCQATEDAAAVMIRRTPMREGK